MRWYRGAGATMNVASLLVTGLAWSGCTRDPNVVVVGSKNFTESIILGEIVAQQLERRGVEVSRKLNLGGSFVCHQAMIANEMDVYIEYTGTAYSAILEFPTTRDRDLVWNTVDSVYAKRWSMIWGPPLGFNNTFAILIRGAMARQLGLTTISEALTYAKNWKAGFGFEFVSRPDGLEGLEAWYGLAFATPPAAMDLSLTYRALAEERVDVIAGNSTDGQIEALDLFQLQDDRGFFPPYEAAPVARKAALERHPALREVIEELGGSITEEAMRRMNYLVDAEGRTVTEVAAEFVDRLGGVRTADEIDERGRARPSADEHGQRN
jgi:osmoprotectant transport system substrate-binding protein